MGTWQIGDRIENRWEVLEIREGGMGIVYVVRDHEWGICLAAKGLKGALLASDPGITARFVREAEVWVGLDCHPNITQAIAVINVLGRPLILLEFVETDLVHWMASGSLPNNLPQVFHLAFGFCDGITYAYSKGIRAHRDIKPSNCLVTSHGDLKVTDFGLVSVLETHGDLGGRNQTGAPNGSDQRPPRLTPTGGRLGTPAYMAPEQFLDAGRVDARADVYAFGVMLYEMLTGCLPFYGRSCSEWADLHALASVPDLPGVLPRELNVLVQRCVAKNAAERFDNFDEVRDSIAKICERVTGRAAPEKSVAPELDSAQWRRKGIGLTDLNHLSEALECFEQSLARDCQDSATWQCKGVTLAKMGRTEDALASTERAIELDPSNARAWGSRALDLLELGKTEQGLKSADRAVELDPNDWTLWTIRTAILNRLKRHEEALRCSDRALQLYTNADTTWLERSRALRALGQNSQALDCSGRAAELNNRSVDALREKAEILLDMGCAQEAIEPLDRALSLNSKTWALWWDKGVALSALKRSPEQQLECFGRCAELAPELPDAIYEKGAALHDLGRIEEALQCYDAALGIEAQNRSALKGKTIALRELGRAEEALVLHDRLIELDPNNATAWNDKGATYVCLGRKDEALRCFNRALEIEPNHRLALHNRATICGSIHSNSG